MRIGMLVDVYKPHVSGITNYISLNKRYLEALGHEVFVFSFGDENHACNEPNVIYSPGLPLADTGYYFSLRYSREARRLLYTVDIAHVHHPFVSGSLALLYCRPRGIPILFTNHTRYDLYAQTYIPMLAEIVNGTALQAYLPFFCRSIDLVISPSAGMREVLQRLGVDAPIDVAPNGVDLRPFQQVDHPQQRATYGFDDQDVILIYTGRLGPEKNLPFLLRSFAGMALVYDHVRLVLVGDGPERANLQDQAQHSGVSDRIHFMGMVPYADMPSYLAMANAFVTASLTEVHPLSVIEAMAAGLPVLGIQSVGVGDIVEDGETGFLAPQEDLAVFTALMVRLTADHALRQEMGLAARQAAEVYDIELTTRLMVERYQGLINQTYHRQMGWRARWTRFMDR